MVALFRNRINTLVSVDRRARVLLYRPAVLLFTALVLTACSDSNNDTPATQNGGTSSPTGDGEPEPLVDVIDAMGVTDSEQVATGAFDTRLFADEGLAEDITVVDCTLSGGTETTCYQIITNGSAAGVTVGPFCPDNISVMNEEEVGLWVDGRDEVYDITGDFIVNLPNLYNDQNWILYDQATGEVNVTKGAEQCAAAANPNVAAENQQQCVECLLEDVDGGIAQTILIPTTPVPLDASVELPANAFTMGVALNAIPLSAPAGIDDILGNYIIAAFDDCGGHINAAEGYHYHGATECNATGTQSDGHAAQIGYAIDGYAIYARLNADGSEPTGLDECLGETDDVRGYHYHAADLSENRIIGCFHGETAGDLGGRAPRPR